MSTNNTSGILNITCEKISEIEYFLDNFIQTDEIVKAMNAIRNARLEIEELTYCVEKEQID